MFMGLEYTGKGIFSRQWFSPNVAGVVFELRGKPFGLRDTGHNEAIFSLCRTWMRGKEEELPKDDEPEVQYPQPTDDSLVS